MREALWARRQWTTATELHSGGYGTSAGERGRNQRERGEGQRALGISLVRGEEWGRAGHREAGGGVDARASSTQLLRSAGVEDDWQATGGLGQPAGPAR